MRDRLAQWRTAVINQIGGFLLERGITFAEGPAELRQQLPAILEDADQKLTANMRNLLDHLWRECKQLQSDADVVSEQIEVISAEDAACQRLRQIPRLGPLIATATIAAIGHAAAFHKGREFAAWLRLVPQQHSTGVKTKLSGINKRGNVYLRRMYTQGARAVLLRAKYNTGALGTWMRQLEG